VIITTRKQTQALEVELASIKATGKEVAPVLYAKNSSEDQCKMALRAVLGIDQMPGNAFAVLRPTLPS
jgi:hypothetical protein